MCFAALAELPARVDARTGFTIYHSWNWLIFKVNIRQLEYA
jgi:hypothetical protein